MKFVTQISPLLNYQNSFLLLLPVYRYSLVVAEINYLIFIFLDGVVLVDPEYLKDRRVFGHVLAAFRYGREDLDVLGKT